MPLVLAFSALFVALLASGALAHALLVSTSPAAGARLGTAPGVVTLRFSEAVNPRLSHVAVSDPTGRVFPGNASGQRMAVVLSTNAPGTYRVRWFAVSLDDGHTTQGSFQFSVVAGGASRVAAQAKLGALGLATSVARAVQYVALLFTIGSLLIARLARRAPEIPWVRTRLRIVLAILVAAATLTVLGDALAASPHHSLSALATYLTSGPPGLSRLFLLPLAAVALLAAVLGAPVWPSVAAVTIALAAAGHPADVRPLWFGISVDALHVLAAGLWAGAIMALATQRVPGGGLGPEGRAMLDRFSPVAISAFLATAGLGVIQAFRFVPSLSALADSPYGRVLVVKAALVAAMLPLSLLAWRRKVAPRAEAGIAVFVVGAAALLSAFPLPLTPTARAAPPGKGAREPVSALPRGGELTFGDHVGTVLVGLTLAPGKPGPNRVLVYLLSLEGNTGSITAQLVSAGRTIPLSVCGPNCRTATVDIHGPENLGVRLGPFSSSLGHFPAGQTTFRIPKLPAPDGTALLHEVQARMHALRTYAMDEVLNSGLASVHSVYSFEAPDRARIDTFENGHFQSVFIGGTRYTRDSPAQPWKVEPGGPPLPVPSFIWDYFKPFIAPRIIGTAVVNGTRTRILSFAGAASGTVIWFRLWVDPAGRVLEAHMRADGHFMDEQFSGFNAPVSIQPPAGA